MFIVSRNIVRKRYLAPRLRSLLIVTLRTSQIQTLSGAIFMMIAFIQIYIIKICKENTLYFLIQNGNASIRIAKNNKKYSSDNSSQRWEKCRKPIISCTIFVVECFIHFMKSKHLLGSHPMFIQTVWNLVVALQVQLSLSHLRISIIINSLPCNRYSSHCDFSGVANAELNFDTPSNILCMDASRF